MKKNNKNQGFTLVETVVVVGILSILGTLIMQFFIQASKTQPKVTANLQLQSTILTGMNKLLRSVREGIHFVTPRLNEDSPIIVFLDKKKNFQTIYAIEDEEYTKHFKKKLFKLVRYETETEPFSLTSPSHDPDKVKLICRNVVSSSFRLSSTYSVTAKVKFANDSQEFEIVSEASLMNAEDDS